MLYYSYILLSVLFADILLMFVFNLLSRLKQTLMAATTMIVELSKNQLYILFQQNLGFKKGDI